MTKDSLQILQDSLKLLQDTNQNLIREQNHPDYLNYFFGVAGVLGTLITIYTVYQSYKSRKLQQFIYKQAQLALEKESTEHELNKTKEELNSVETRLTDLQKQIQKDLPIEARKAVLKDRLEESLENLKKYYDDIISTKTKLAQLGVTNQISDELLKSIQEEIEPRFLLKEKISTYQTYLTIVTTLSGIAFALLPYPFENYLGGTFLLLGLPIAIQIVRLTLVKNSKDKQKTTLTLKLGFSFIGTILTTVSALFFWTVILTSNRNKTDTDLLTFAIVLTVLSIIVTFVNYRLFKKYRRMNKATN